MSTIEQTKQGIPTGTWQADTVHSRVAFEVPYAVATFTGEVTDFEASLVDGKLTGAAKIASIKVKEENLEAHLLPPTSSTPSSTPLSASPAATSSATATRSRSTARSPSRASRSRPRSPARSPARPSTTSARTASGSSWRRSVDRTQFDMNWNMPLPNGEPALGNEVTLKAELTLVAQEA